MTPLWKMSSGEFAGWRVNDAFYNPAGHHIGYFKGLWLYSLRGEYKGEIFKNDWLGKPRTLTRPGGRTQAILPRLTLTPPAKRSPFLVAGWQDPAF